MQIKFNFKNFEPSEHLMDYAQTRFNKLDKYIKNSNNAHLLVNLEVEKFRQMAEAVFTANDINISSQHETEDMYATIDGVLDKLEKQLKKIRGKQKDKRKGKLNKGEGKNDLFSMPASAGDEELNIVQTDRFEPKPMDVIEAVNQLQKSDYNFLVFFNADKDDKVNVVYKRKNGDFGLIDPRM